MLASLFAKLMLGNSSLNLELLGTWWDSTTYTRAGNADSMYETDGGSIDSLPVLHLSLIRPCRGDGAAAALEHAQLRCSGQDPEEAWWAGLQAYIRDWLIMQSACYASLVALHFRTTLALQLGWGPTTCSIHSCVTADKNSGVVLRAPFLASVLKQVTGHCSPTLTHHPSSLQMLGLMPIDAISPTGLLRLTVARAFCRGMLTGTDVIGC